MGLLIITSQFMLPYFVNRTIINVPINLSGANYITSFSIAISFAYSDYSGRMLTRKQNYQIITNKSIAVSSRTVIVNDDLSKSYFQCSKI